MFPQIPDHYRWIVVLLLLTSLFGLFWWWNRRAKKWLEDNDRLEPEPPNALDWLLGRQQQNPKPTTLRYSEEEFREMISKVLDELPEEFDKEWKNVAVVHSTGWPADIDKKRMCVAQGHVVSQTLCTCIQARYLQWYPNRQSTAQWYNDNVCCPTG